MLNLLSFTTLHSLYLELKCAIYSLKSTLAPLFFTYTVPAACINGTSQVKPPNLRIVHSEYENENFPKRKCHLSN